MGCHNFVINKTEGTNTEIVEVKSFSEVEAITTTVILPQEISTPVPLIAMHGISRNVSQMVQEFSIEASIQGRIVVLPHFVKKAWPVFQRINDTARPDKGLLALIETLRKMKIVDHDTFNLFGYSGGAQLAHRFTMLYPELVHQLHLGAAGWYTLPTTQLAYPLGLGPDKHGDHRWGRRMESGLKNYLKKKITVYIGSEDTLINDSLRNKPSVNNAQGHNRLDRAHHYVSTLRHLQSKASLKPDAELIILNGCGHNFLQCSTKGRLASLICSS